VTMALYELEEPHLIEHYSAALLNERGSIIRFQEKPRPEEAVSNLAGTGFYLIRDNFLERNLPDYLEACKHEGVRPDRIGDLWERFVDGVPLYGYVFRGTWLDIGNLEMYLRANQVVLESTAEKVDSPVPRSVSLEGKGIRIEADVELGRDVVVSGPVLIEEGCRVAERSRVGPYVRLGRGSEVGEGSELRDSVVFEEVRIGGGSRIEGSALDGRCRLGEGCVVEGYSILGFGVVLGDGVTVIPGSRVWPFATMVKGTSVEGDRVTSLSRGLEERLSASRFWED
ncbi:MAG: sugar phosphate nucleotidyltransferase, partial [Candidatus Geothermarchaeales archaeon]